MTCMALMRTSATGIRLSREEEAAVTRFDVPRSDQLLARAAHTVVNPGKGRTFLARLDAVAGGLGPALPGVA